jgi:hypothetical protein
LIAAIPDCTSVSRAGSALKSPDLGECTSNEVPDSSGRNQIDLQVDNCKSKGKVMTIEMDGSATGASAQVCQHYCIDEVIRHSAQVGNYFFSEGAMRFFSSRTLSAVYGGRFFVTSEQDRGTYSVWNGERRYTVRECNRGEIETRSVFGEFSNAEAGKKAARNLARSEQR